MSLGRRSARRRAVFTLYQWDLLGLSHPEALKRADAGDGDPYASSLVRGVLEQHEAIDQVVQQHVAGWSLERLGILERSILRLATYELLWEANVPEAVIMDEAVELAKRFCSDEAGALINGILGSVAISESARIQSIRPGRQTDSRVPR